MWRSRGPSAPLGRRFYLLWSGESSATLGTAFLEFALGVWVYNQTHSVVAFADVVLAALLPSVLVLPLAGSVADTLGRRRVVIASDVVMACLVLLVIGLLRAHALHPASLYIFNILASLVSAFRRPAYQAAVSAVLPPDGFTRGAGLSSLSKNVAALIAPLVAGVVIADAGLAAILELTLALFAVGTFLVARALSRPRVRRPWREDEAADQVGDGSGHAARANGISAHIGGAIRFFRAAPLMSGLLLYSATRAALFAAVTLMITPLILSSQGSDVLGLVYLSAGVGGLAGASSLILLGDGRRLLLHVIRADLLLGLCIIALGLTRSTPVFCMLAFVGVAASSLADGAISALWMRKMPGHVRASLFGIVAMVTTGLTTLAILGGGLLVDRVFQPALSPDGLWAHGLGTIIGIGPGRGTALLLVACGGLSLMLAIGVLCCRPLRRIDLLEPDRAMPERAPDPRLRMREA